MKKIILIYFFVQSFCWSLSSCHKETNDLIVPVDTTQSFDEIVNDHLPWSYYNDQQYFCARVTYLQEPPGPNSADSIKAVYQIANGTFVQLSRGNPGNSDSVYYDVVAQSLYLYKKYSANSVQAAIELAILNITGFAGEISRFNVPGAAKVVFR
jgi:hypothetical protein